MALRAASFLSQTCEAWAAACSGFAGAQAAQSSVAQLGDGELVAALVDGFRQQLLVCGWEAGSYLVVLDGTYAEHEMVDVDVDVAVVVVAWGDARAKKGFSRGEGEAAEGSALQPGEHVLDRMREGLLASHSPMYSALEVSSLDRPL